MAKQDDFVRITLRLPPWIHSQLTEMAGPGGSLNAEIIRRLQRSVEDSLLGPPKPSHFLRVVLDGRDQSLSIRQVQEHVAAAVDALKDPIHELQIEVITKEIAQAREESRARWLKEIDEPSQVPSRRPVPPAEEGDGSE